MDGYIVDWVAVKEFESSYDNIWVYRRFSVINLSTLATTQFKESTGLSEDTGVCKGM